MSAHGLELLGPQTTATLVLLSARVGGLVLIAPVFSSRNLPAMLRTSVVVLLSWLLFPAAVGAASAAAVVTPAAALSEAMIGFAIGLGAAVFVGAAEAAGDLLSIHIGLSGAAALDPLTNQSIPVLGQFCSLFAVAALLAVDAHLLMLDALTASLRLLPIGAPVDLSRGFASMLSLLGALFLTGLRFAAPVLAAVLLANVALAILTRAAPQLNILSVAFPVQIGLGLLALMASVPLLGTFFTTWDETYESVVMRLFRALGGG